MQTGVIMNAKSKPSESHVLAVALGNLKEILDLSTQRQMSIQRQNQLKTRI